MSARGEALSMSASDVAERARRSAEAREAQALLDALEPGSDQAAKLLESAARKGIKLRVRHTLVDRTAIDAVAEGLARDYARHEADVAAARRKKLAGLAIALCVAVVVAGGVVAAVGALIDQGAPAPVGAARDVGGAPVAQAPAEPARASVEATAPPTVSEAPREAPRPAAPREQCAAPPAVAAPPPEPEPQAPAPPPAHEKSIEPYFGTR